LTTRQIWKDLQDEIRELSRNELPTEDPRDDNVNPNVRVTEPEAIEIEGLDWEDFGVEIEGQFDFREPLSRVTDQDIEREWTGGKTTDSCAWYESYHFGHKHWGIHFSEYCVLSVGERFWHHGQYKTKTDAIKGALLFLFLHEFFHYITDNASAVLEVVSGTPFLYDRYSRNVYMKMYSSPGALEEALAERYLFGRAKRICKLKDKNYLRKILLMGPPGYSDSFALEALIFGREEGACFRKFFLGCPVQLRNQ
jgi:hypothetical protein